MTPKFRNKVSEILDRYEDDTDDLHVRINLNRKDGITSVSSTGYLGFTDFEFQPTAYFDDGSKAKKPKSFQAVLDLINNHIG